MKDAVSQRALLPQVERRARLNHRLVIAVLVTSNLACLAAAVWQVMP